MPRPIRSLSGVRMPNWHPRSGPIVPTPPTTDTPIPRPHPHPIDDNTRRDLVRRWHYSNYADTTYVNGWPYQSQPVVVSDGPMPAIYRPWSPSILRTGGYWAIPVRDASTGLIRGTYNGDNWRLAFAIGSQFPTINYRLDSSLYKYPVRMYRSRYWPWSDALRYAETGVWPGTYSYMLVGDTSNQVIDPALLAPSVQSQTPARELTPLEQAEIALRGGRGEIAEKYILDYLKDEPNDWSVRRMLALAKLEERKMEQAVAVLADAYIHQPQLARDEIAPEAMSGGEMAHRNRFSAAMDYANRTKTASAYLLAVVLAQSEGRYDVALKLLARAEAAGLDGKVAEELKFTLSSR